MSTLALVDGHKTSMRENSASSIKDLYSGLATILKPASLDSLLQALPRLRINDECSIIILRRCQLDSQGIPMLEVQATWSKDDESVWQEPIVTDDESLAKVWVLSAGPPLFVEDYEEFALFTGPSRKFYLDQGVVSLYRILVKREEQCIAMLTVMWTSPQTFSNEYKL